MRGSRGPKRVDATTALWTLRLVGDEVLAVRSAQWGAFDVFNGPRPQIDSRSAAFFSHVGLAPLLGLLSSILGTDPACPRRAADLPTAEDPRLTGRQLLVVNKAQRRLMLYTDGVLRLCRPVGLGFAPKGHKRVEGDGKTPEGWYRTSDKPWSSFEHAIAVHYPNIGDARAAAADGRISKKTRDTIVNASKRRRVPPQRTAMGGAILIHGGGSGTDWTARMRGPRRCGSGGAACPHAGG